MTSGTELSLGVIVTDRPPGACKLKLSPSTLAESLSEFPSCCDRIPYRSL